MPKVRDSIGCWNESLAKETWGRGLSWRGLVLKETFVGMWRKALEIREDRISKGMAILQVKSGEGLNLGSAAKGKDNRLLDISVSKSRVTLGHALGTSIASFLGHWQCLLWGPAFFYLVPLLLLFPGKAHMTFQAHPAFSSQVGLRTRACSEDAHVTRIYHSWA